MREMHEEQEKREWERFSFLASHVINISGKQSRRTVKPSDLINFDRKPQALDPDFIAEAEQRIREMNERNRRNAQNHANRKY